MKPIIKWTGGKRWLVPKLEEIFSPYRNASYRLVEPFTGGMAMALGLNPSAALLNDINPHLINFYRQIQKGLKIDIEFKNSKTAYYSLRDHFNALIRAKKHATREAASIFYYLIRTGYNGLCRFNNEGEFNVPFGQHHSILYRKDFLEYQPILKPWEFRQGDFEKLALKENDFIYADPPYDVEFTKYSKEDFTWESQLRLVQWLSKHKGPVVASNQATDRIIKLYEEFGFEMVILSAPRSIACTGDRKPAAEILAYRNKRV